MNAENPVQIDLFGVSATRTKDARLAEHIRRLLLCNGRDLSLCVTKRKTASEVK